MLQHTIVSTAAVAAFFVSLCSAYPQGAAPKGCDTLAPVHSQGSILPQTSESPYSIQVDSNEWQQSGTVSVTITGGSTPINGFILQARKKGTTEGIGSFDETSLPSATQLGPCKLDGVDISVTHTDNSDKQDLVFTWNAPDSGYDGVVFFQGAVVQDHNTYWSDLMSEDLTMAASPAGGNGSVGTGSESNTDDGSDTGTDDGSDVETDGTDMDSETDGGSETGTDTGSESDGSSDGQKKGNSAIQTICSLAVLIAGVLACLF